MVSAFNSIRVHLLIASHVKHALSTTLCWTQTSRHGGALSPLSSRSGETGVSGFRAVSATDAQRSTS